MSRLKRNCSFDHISYSPTPIVSLAPQIIHHFARTPFIFDNVIFIIYYSYSFLPSLPGWPYIYYSIALTTLGITHINPERVINVLVITRFMIKQ